MLKKRYCLVLTIVIISVFFISFSVGDEYNRPVNIVNASLIQPHDRVLIVAPHPDDESISCAGVVHHCVKNNIPIKIVVLTDGCLGAPAMTRHNETVAAMSLLGVKQDDILFLGYRDGSLPRLLNQNWKSINPYNINGTINNGNYIFSYRKNSTYSGEDLYDNLVEIINNFQPTVVFYPDSEDEQIDHWGSYAFLEYVLAKTNYTGDRYTYIVHNPPDWPSPRTYDPEADITSPPELTAIGYKWVSFPLDEYQERLKEAAFDSYPSQISKITYIRSFIRTNELFGIVPVKQINLSSKSLDFFSNNLSPETVIQEPVKNDRGKGSIRTRELTSVGFGLDHDNAWIFIKAKNNISLAKWYEVHILYLDSANFGRIDLKIYNGTAYYQNFNSYSYHSNDSKVNIEGDVIKIQIPSSAFDHVNSFLISADILNGSTLIDWTGWREVEINR